MRGASIAFAVSSSLFWQASSESRKLAEHAPIATYQPDHNVQNALNIDKDLALMEQLLAAGNEDSVEQAANVYTQGAFSIPFAELELTNPVLLEAPIEEGTLVRGENALGRVIQGQVLATAPVGAGSLQVAYLSSADASNTAVCSVGGNPNPVYDGCFATQGVLQIGGSTTTLTYEYDPTLQNKNYRNIAEMSTDARANYWDCGEENGCPYALYKQYRDYYGEYDYANQWIVQSLLKGETEFARGNADWNTFDEPSAVYQSISIAAAVLNVALFAVGEFQGAIVKCNQAKDTDSSSLSDSAVFQWDAGVAYWTGSRSNNGQGHLLYSVADARCNSFQTCAPADQAHPGNEFGATSKVNIELFELFTKGKDEVRLGNCEAAQEDLDRISQLMMVPMMQGLLRYAHKNRGTDVYEETSHAKGAAYAAAVLPVIHRCNKRDASLIFNNMKAVKTTNFQVDFAQVKEALERNYECLQLTCEDVGGLWDEDVGAYHPGAEPCTGTPQQESDSRFDRTTIEILGIALGGVLAALILVCGITYWCKCRRSTAYTAEETKNLQRQASDLALEDGPNFTTPPMDPPAMIT